jgi:hypothetical protein
LGFACLFFVRYGTELIFMGGLAIITQLMAGRVVGVWLVLFCEQTACAAHSLSTEASSCPKLTANADVVEELSGMSLLQSQLSLERVAVVHPDAKARATPVHTWHKSGRGRRVWRNFLHALSAKDSGISLLHMKGDPTLLPGELRVNFGHKKVESPSLRKTVLLAFLVLTCLTFCDWYRFMLLHKADSDAHAAALLMSGSHGKAPVVEEKQSAQQADRVPIWFLIALGSYRFYTGFLAATWLPYLLAMEGNDLYHENQSLFMGVAKLIYGLTILTNPLLGLIGDRAVALSHGVGRRMFLRTGMAIAGCGMYGCFLADYHHYFYCFVVGITLWRIGDATTDVTTEALMPEMVPSSQFTDASNIKSALFVLGGIFGYVALILMEDYHYTWLYLAYAFGMLIFSIPTQVLLADDAPLRGRSTQQAEGFLMSMHKAYIAPAFQDSWFPKLALAIFIFGFGTSPMFFLLLMIRDLVGTTNPVHLQNQFSTSSIMFFVAAAISTVIGGLIDKWNAPNQSSKEEQEQRVLISRLTAVVYVSGFYGLVCLAIPTVSLFHSSSARVSIFYCCAVLLGASFGSGFARFQDLTWRLLPAGNDSAKAMHMGFSLMCRLFGVGLGNFVAGWLLDWFTIKNHGGPSHGAMNGAAVTDLDKVYKPIGYVVMMCTCAVACSGSLWVALRIKWGLLAKIEGAPARAA